MLIIKWFGSVIKFACFELHQGFIVKINSNLPQLLNFVVFGKIMSAGRIVHSCLSRVSEYVTKKRACIFACLGLDEVYWIALIT